MRVLVIGGTGFLSTAIVSESLAAGHEVSIVTRGSKNRPGPPPGVEALTANRSHAESMRAALDGRDFDLVIDAILYRPDDARAITEILRGRTGRYVFISTDFVYGGEPRLFPITEDAPRESLNAYGRYKTECEDIFFAVCRDEGFPAVILRPPHILGAGGVLGTGSREGRDPWLLWRLRNGYPVVLLDGGALLIQPVHRDDIARACLAVAGSESTIGKAYNIGGPDCVTTRRYYELVAEVAGAPLPLEVLSLPSEAYAAAQPNNTPFTQNRAYSLGRLVRDALFVPTVTLADAIAEMVAALDAKGLPDGPPPEKETPLTALLRAHRRAVQEELTPRA
jgi:nucleoside-diphosphate-sugar epimerase